MSSANTTGLSSRFTALYSSGHDLFTQGKRRPFELIPVLKALQLFKEDKGIKVLGPRDVLTPFLPIPAKIKAEMVKLDRAVLSQKHFVDDYTLESTTFCQAKRQFTEEELTWVMAMVHEYSLPVWVGLHHHNLSFNVLDHAFVKGSVIQPRYLMGFLGESIPIPQSEADVSIAARNKNIDMQYARFLEVLRPNPLLRRVRHFYGFGPLPRNALLFHLKE